MGGGHHRFQDHGVCHGNTFRCRGRLHATAATRGPTSPGVARVQPLVGVAVTPTQLTRLTLAVMVAAAAVGAGAAGLEGDWDLAVIFVALAVLAAVLLARTSTRRPLVPIRGDLVRWMSARAALDGDRTERLADRAIAAYRDGLSGQETDKGVRAED